MPPLGRVVEHVVERHDLEYVDRPNVEDLRDFRRRLEGDVSELALHQVERGQQRAASLGVLPDLAVDSGARLGGDHHSSAPFIHS